MMLPLAISTVERLRSVLRVFGVRGGNAYHDRKDTRNPSQEKKKTFPWRQKGFYNGINLGEMHGLGHTRIGTHLALLLIGLTSGAVHS
jgi:hypothetical protein